MKRHIKYKAAFITMTVIAIISVLLNVYLVLTRTKSFKQEINNQTLNDNENIVENIDTNKQEENNENKTIETEEKKPEKEYVYKYIEGEEKEVIVEKEVEVPASSTDAVVTYVDANGNTKDIELPSGTTITFSAGEHGTYDAIPSSITLTDNQQLDITDSSYNPSLVEVNYIFKGFSYTGNAFKAEYQLASNTINVDVKKYNEVLIDSESIKYARSEYIENIDKQYINTGKTINNNSYFELKCSWTEIADVTSVLWGCIGSGSVNNYIRVRTNSGNYISTEFRRQMSSLTSGDVFPVKSYEIYTIKKDLSDLSHITVNDHTYTAPSSAVVNFPNENVYLFLESAGSPERHGKGRIYSYQIWTSNDKTSLSKDFVPAKRLSDNKYGLLELVENKFYFSPDGGNFKGNDILNNDKNAGIVIGSGTYDVGSDIELKAIANDGYIFSSWSDGLMEETRTISIGDTNTYSAIFVSN